VTIAEFLLALATDPGLRARFDNDPESVLKEHQITGPKAQVLLAGRLREIRVRVEAELELDGEVVVFHTIHIHLPHIPLPS